MLDHRDETGEVPASHLRGESIPIQTVTTAIPCIEMAHIRRQWQGRYAFNPAQSPNGAAGIGRHLNKEQIFPASFMKRKICNSPTRHGLGVSRWLPRIKAGHDKH